VQDVLIATDCDFLKVNETPLTSVQNLYQPIKNRDVCALHIQQPIKYLESRNNTEASFITGQRRCHSNGMRSSIQFRESIHSNSLLQRTESQAVTVYICAHSLYIIYNQCIYNLHTHLK